MGIPCFLLEPVDRTTGSWQVICPNDHEERVDVDEPIEWDAVPWPTHCAACGVEHEYEGGSHRSTTQHRWFRRADTGEEVRLRDVGPGAMWDAYWMGDFARINGTGPRLAVRLPNGHDWMPGSQASNCGRPGEDHDCWCVHGEPPHLTVDKTPEPGRTTCTAGAGSIGSGSGADYWHGFLRNGELVE